MAVSLFLLAEARCLQDQALLMNDLYLLQSHASGNTNALYLNRSPDFTGNFFQSPFPVLHAFPAHPYPFAVGWGFPAGVLLPGYGY